MNALHKEMVQEVFEVFSVVETIAAVELLDIHTEVDKAIGVLRGIIEGGKVLAVSYSGGKDSSVVAALSLTAARQVVASTGRSVRVVICHGDTLTENPAVANLARSEMEKMLSYAEQYGIDLDIRIATPRLSENYFLNILSGRTVANLPDGGSKCSMDLKVRPITRMKREVAAAYGADLITVLGTRLDESAHRERNMKSRGESAVTPVKNKDGDYILSPIMYWSLDNVFEFIGYSAAGEFDAYSDFSGLLELYRNANGGACELVAYADGKAPKSGCGARTGCWHCQRAPEENESLENMLSEPQNGYMKGLAALRRYIRATHYDPSKRNWLARSINDDGTIDISPVAYSPKHCEDLISFCLTLDAEEREAAATLGIAPRFEILSPADVVSIDFRLSRYGYSDAMVACRLYDNVHNKGMRYPVPEGTPVYPKAPFPKAVKATFCDDAFDSVAYGFRDVEAAMVDAESLVAKADGVYYSGGAGGDEFRVDEEGAELFMAFELDRALKTYSGESVFPAAVMHYFLRLGTVEIYRGSHSAIDKTLRVSNQIHRSGLRSVLHDRDALLAKLGQAAGDEVGKEQLSLI